MARSMLSEYNVIQSFWVEAINMACYYSNRLYCHPLKEKTLLTVTNTHFDHQHFTQKHDKSHHMCRILFIIHLVPLVLVELFVCREL
jgi:hypothetical protein